MDPEPLAELETRAKKARLQYEIANLARKTEDASAGATMPSPPPPVSKATVSAGADMPYTPPRVQGAEGTVAEARRALLTTTLAPADTAPMQPRPAHPGVATTVASALKERTARLRDDPKALTWATPVAQVWTDNGAAPGNTNPTAPTANLTSLMEEISALQKLQQELKATALAAQRARDTAAEENAQLRTELERAKAPGNMALGQVETDPAKPAVGEVTVTEAGPVGTDAAGDIAKQGDSPCALATAQATSPAAPSPCTNANATDALASQATGSLAAWKQVSQATHEGQPVEVCIDSSTEEWVPAIFQRLLDSENCSVLFPEGNTESVPVVIVREPEVDNDMGGHAFVAQ